MCEFENKTGNILTGDLMWVSTYAVIKMPLTHISNWEENIHGLKGGEMSILI